LAVLGLCGDAERGMRFTLRRTGDQWVMDKP
jgi:hypothetical protein